MANFAARKAIQLNINGPGIYVGVIVNGPMRIICPDYSGVIDCMMRHPEPQIRLLTKVI